MWRVCYLLVQTVDTWLVIPGAFAALVSGIALSLVTPWGLARYWWVLVTLVLTVVVILFSTFLWACGSRRASSPGSHHARSRSSSPSARSRTSRRSC